MTGGLIDTHCHLYLEEFDPDREEAIVRAKESGIEALLLPNVDTTTIGRMLDLTDQHPEFVFPMMGLHPTSVDGGYAKSLAETESWLDKRPYCGIGEIGIDLYWDKTWLKEQKIVFEEQLRWSIDRQLPVAIHTRDAFAEVFDSIHKVGAEKLTGVFHSFSGNEAELEEIQQMPGFMIGINGVVTFKNSRLSEVIARTTIDRILLETDAPYLSPVPYRGRRNEPVYIWKTAEKIASVYGLTVGEVAENTRKNVLNLFRNINKNV
ncbi:TatD family hydrolase [Parabacteroides sp. OttesenSCG-928-O15]|nr:TatD family hydrolase [Parabacteroides sp. OttesenSCG-928-O15]